MSCQDSWSNEEGIPPSSPHDIIISLSILIGSKSAIAANFTPYITIPGLDRMTGATRHSRDTAAPPQTIMSPHVMFYDLLCPDMNSVLLVLLELVLVLEPGCGCQLSQLSRCLGDDLVLPHDHISLGPGLTALVNCIVFYSKLKTRKIMFTKQS